MITLIHMISSSRMAVLRIFDGSGREQNRMEVNQMLIHN